MRQAVGLRGRGETGVCVCLWCTLTVPLLSSADSSAHSTDTSNKFVFGQNMSERVLVSGPGWHCYLLGGSQHVAVMLSPVQSGQDSQVQE